ncbi:MAG: YdcF family protein [Actinomycetota bacterium]|nr:YdcF family protein [Actinomycetota bacterium]MDA8281387.1 YdcF family protein [Actinomycetota bacterium]
MGVVAGWTAWRLVRRLVRTALLLAVLAAGYLVVTAVQVWLTSRHSDPHKAQAIVVMGAAQYNGVPSADLQARLATADQLWNEGMAPIVVVTGSKQPGDAFTEAQASATWLTAHGVPATDIVQVGGRDSWANLSDAARVLVPEHRTQVLMVTDGFHEDRSMAIATSVGLHPSPVPAVDSPIRGTGSIPYFAKETVGVAVGRVIGYQRLDLFDHL